MCLRGDAPLTATTHAQETRRRRQRLANAVCPNSRTATGVAAAARGLATITCPGISGESVPAASHELISSWRQAHSSRPCQTVSPFSASSTSSSSSSSNSSPSAPHRRSRDFAPAYPERHPVAPVRPCVVSKPCLPWPSSFRQPMFHRAGSFCDRRDSVVAMDDPERACDLALQIALPSHEDSGTVVSRHGGTSGATVGLVTLTLAAVALSTLVLA